MLFCHNPLVYIVDTTGRVIVHPNPSVVLKGEYFNVDNKSGTGTGLDGKKVFLTNDILNLGSQHMHVVTEIPLVKALKDTYTSLLTIAVFLFLTLTSSVILGFVIVRQIIRPVESLAETAQAISSGDINRRSYISRNDELGALSDTFNLMTSRLAETITSLKREITRKETAEKKIRWAYEEWQRTFDSISQPVSLHDREYRIIRANKAFSDFFKISFSELIGKKCYEIFHGSHEPWLNCPHTKTMKTGTTSTEELFETRLNKHMRITTSPILDNRGEITGSVHIAEDITERKNTEQSLRESERSYRTLAENLPGIVYRVFSREKNRIRFFNRMNESLTGYREDELSGGGVCSIESFMHPEDRLNVQKAIKKAIAAGESFSVEYRFLHKNGGIKHFLENGTPITGSDGNLLYIDGFIFDITERIKAEESTLESEKKYRALFDQAPYSILLVDGDTGELVEFNDKACETLGYTREEFRHIKIHDFEVFESEDAVLKHINKIIEQGYDIFETKHRRKDGKILDMLVNCRAIPLGGRNISLSLLIDITEQKIADDLIKSSLQEKEVLLKELHHRVKNNMQVVSSLLNLQSQHVDDKRYINMFEESKNRIMAMALVHENLYRSRDLARIDLDDYITSLANNLLTSYDKHKYISLKIEAADIHLAVDTAIPCGLIINELISNCLKHAFPEGRHGKLQINFHELNAANGDKEYELLVKDNGIGIPEGLDIRKTRSLGLQLVSNLGEHQLQGTLELKRDDGTEFSLRFKEPSYKKRI